MSVLDVVGGGPSDKQGWIKGVGLGLGLELEIGVVGDELEMDFVIFWVWMIWEMVDYALVLVGFQKVELKGREGRNLENWVWGQTLKQKIGECFPC